MSDLFERIVLPLLFLFYLAVTAFQLAGWLGIFARFGQFLSSSARKAPSNSNSPLRLSPDGEGKWSETSDSNFADLPFPISIVVCARNEAENLQQNLPLWLAQEYAGAWELLIVDDASDDTTPAILQAFQQKNPRLRVIRMAEKKSLGKKAALTLGVSSAHYEQLLLTDGDCAPASVHWLAQMAGSLAEKPVTEIALGYAPLVAAPGLLNSWARFETAYTALQYFAFAQVGMPYMGVGRNMAWKRSLFYQAGGFVRHADVPSGDDDLLVNAVARRGRVALCLTPASFVYSAAKTTWAAWFRQKQRQLGSSLRYQWWHQLIIGAVAATHTLHYLAALLLLIAFYHPVLMLSVWLLRLAVIMLVWRRVLQGFQERALLAWVPLHDILLSIYYAAFVPFSFLRGRKGVKWK